MANKKLLLVILVLSLSLSLVFAGCSIIFGGEDDTKTVTISFDSVGGNEVASISGQPGMRVAAPNNPTKEKNTFDGWYTSSDYSTKYEFKYFPEEDIKLYAKWIEEEVTITLVGNGGEGSSLSPIKNGEDIVLPIDWTKEGYTFDGWYLAEDFSGDKILKLEKVTASISVYAKWKANYYTITFDTNGGNKIDPISAQYQTEIEVIDPTKEGFIFSGWFKEKECINAFEETLVPLGDITLYAKWVECFNISYYDGSNKILVDQITKNKVEGFDIINSRYFNPDFYFGGWYYDETFTQPLDTTALIKGDISLYGKFIRRDFTPYLEEFNSHGDKTSDLIIIDSEEKNIALIDYIQFTDCRAGKNFKLDYKIPNVVTQKEIFDAIFMKILKSTNNSSRIAFGTIYGISNGYFYRASDYPKDEIIERADNYVTIENQQDGLIPTVDNVFKSKITPLRALDNDVFKYQELYTKHITVETSNQLFYALEHGLYPDVVSGSSAEKMYNKAKEVLNTICNDTMSEVEKMYAIYTWFSDNVQYDKQAADKKEQYVSNYYDAWHLEGVFNNHVAVCDGIAKSVVVLARMEGITCIRITGAAYGVFNQDGHAWNKVYLDLNNDGVKEWYCMDATWSLSGCDLVQDAINEVTHKVQTVEYFLFKDGYDKRMDYNYLDIKATTDVNPYDVVNLTIGTNTIDLYYDETNEVNGIIQYIHDYVNLYEIDPIFTSIEFKATDIIAMKLNIEGVVGHFSKAMKKQNDKSNIDKDVEILRINLKEGNIFKLFIKVA